MFLASKSPQRKALLTSLGVDFDIVLPDYHEVDPPGASPGQLVERHSRGKALSVLPSLVPLNPERPVLGVDTLVVIEDEAIGKAAGKEEARGFLERLSGGTHQVVSGVTLIWAAASEEDTEQASGAAEGGSFSCRHLTEDDKVSQTGLWQCTGHAVTTVKFSAVPGAELEAYLSTGEWRGRAGAYAIQERASSFVEEIEGDYTNVVGLPVSLLVAMLRAAGLWPPRGWTGR